jgi:excinuclease ABC subunit C
LPEEADDGEESGMLALQESLLTELRGSAVRIQAAHGADEQRLVDMAAINAREEALRRRANLPAALAGALQLAGPPGRIECVDVSHSAGQATRVGMVVFEDGSAEKSAYRVYALDNTGGDDHAALRAWLPRRLESGPPWPDLLLVDGGRGQLATVQRALEDAGQAGLFALASIAKAREDGKSDRRAGKIADRVFLPGRGNPVPLKPGCPELLFLQHIRDCAHHFALGAHRKARGKEALAGELSRIPGIGPATAKLLWTRFDSLAAMRRATPAELEAMPGIGRHRAALLIEKLKMLG